MKLDVVWWKSVGVLFTAGILLAGCGKSKPAPAPDISAPADTTTTSDNEAPPERVEDTQYVDPNSQYASILKPIHFEYNKYRVTEQAKPTLEGIAKLLNQNATWKVLIEGHCDDRGTNEYNLTLGEQRAQATRRYLASLGVDDSRFQTVSYGEERPVDPGHDEGAWAANRRVEFKVEAPRS